MATSCGRECESCRQDNHSTYVCLRSESEFLASLLRLAIDDKGRKNLLGYEPSDLIDWFLYAKRSFASCNGKDEFTIGLQLLDELGKIIFNLTQVTAPRQKTTDQASAHQLLTPLESRLVSAFMGPDSFPREGIYIKSRDDRYEIEKANALDLCKFAGRQLEDPHTVPSWMGRYETELECRIAYTDIRGIGCFQWVERETTLLLIQSNSEQNPDDALNSAILKLACVYLHGVARFAMSSSESRSDLLGYILQEWKGTDLSALPTSNELAEPVVPSREGIAGKNRYSQIPDMHDSRAAQIACELAASFSDEFYAAFPAKPEECFDLLFMCKQSREDGWFWAFNLAQLDALVARCRTDDPLQTFDPLPALRRFRFAKAGVINHFERSECLVEEIQDFNKEKFICLAAGYHLEATNDIALEFARVENQIPGVLHSSYAYFRLTPRPEDGTQTLPAGALVAILRFQKGAEASPATRVPRMTMIRRLLEGWRAKIDSIQTVEKVVKQLARPSQEKTARAAIMSRNLSHNVGSHSLANSRFFDAIGVLNQVNSAPPGARQNETLVFSHREGEDASPVRLGEVWRARTRLGSMNSYLQGRMDFIARALGESPSHSEPMFFINDIVKGFLSQSVLLNTLVSDNGYTAQDLTVKVTTRCLTDNQPQIVEFNGIATDDEIRHVGFEAKPASFNDILVAIPGGMVGRHAFFAFMENIIRNATKYGSQARGRGGTDRLTIELILEERNTVQGALRRDTQGDPQACYVLTVLDNVSADPDGTIAKKVRGSLDQEIIDEDGRPRTEGHGIQEMKVCAQFLAGGEREALVFPADYDKGPGIDCIGDSYRAYIEDSGRVVPVQRRNSLLCFNIKREGGAFLAYSLLLQQPRLLGIVDFAVQQDFECQPTQDPSVILYRDIRTLAENPAYFGLVLLRDTNQLVSVLAEIAAIHTALPFRLMIVIEKPFQSSLGEGDPTKSIEDAIEQWRKAQETTWWKQAGQDKGRIAPFPLPDRRVHAVVCPGLFSEAKDRSPQKWKELILEIYDHWLQAFKGKELEARAGTCQSWHLAIGFDRNRAWVEEKWSLGGPGSLINLGFNSTQVVLDICYKEGGITQFVSSASEPPLKLPVASLLALDNHGNVISGMDLSPEFYSTNPVPAYHPFSGSEQISLFQLLESPPLENFSRGFLIFSVAEALLTRIAIVDERLADATLYWAAQQPWVFDRAGSAEKMHMARIIPIYSIHSEVLTAGGTSEPTRHFLSDSVRRAFDVQQDLDREGIHLSPYQRLQMPSPLITGIVPRGSCALVDARAEQPEFRPDIFVIHEGVTDLLFEKGAWPLEAHQEIFSYCPFVVRTSGRGSISRHLSGILPFLEFSELSDATYQQMNKVALAKGLMALRGSVQPS